MVKENNKVFLYKSYIKKVVIKHHGKILHKLFVWVYLKEVCLWGGGVVFILFFYYYFILFILFLGAGFYFANFGSLAPLIFFKQFFFIKIYFLSYEMLHIFCFYKHTSFSRILNFPLLK